MNREEFLSILEKELLDLNAEERKEALQFYRELFDEAGASQE